MLNYLYEAIKHYSCDIDAITENDEEKSFYILQISSDREQKYVCVYSLKKQSDSIIKMLSSQGFAKVSFAERDGTPLQITSKLKAEKTPVQNQLIESHIHSPYNKNCLQERKLSYFKYKKTKGDCQ